MDYDFEIADMARLVEEVKKGNEVIKKKNEEIARAKLQVQKYSEQANLLVKVLSDRIRLEKERKSLNEELSILLDELEIASNHAQNNLLNGTEKGHTNEWQSIIDANTELKKGNGDNTLKLLKKAKAVGEEIAMNLGCNLLFELMKTLI